MADSSHKRETARRKPRAALIAAPLAVLATAAAVTLGVAGSPAAPKDLLSADAHVAADAIGAPHRDPVITRDLGSERGTPEANDLSRLEQLLSPKAVSKAIKDADTSLWTTATLNLWTRPDDTAKKVGELESGKKVLVTGRKAEGRQEVVVGGDARWVTTGYLSKDKPLGGGGPLSTAPCPDSSVEDGLVEATVLVYRAVCHLFPQVTEYGGWAPRVEHNTGHALDVMVYGDKALGDAIAAWAQAHAAELNLYDIIWYDRIWTPVRSAEGWRDYGDHGSATANHMDHVHIGTN